jgi:hypothetical protein
MSRRVLLALICVFVATRLAGAWLADHPAVYEHGGSIVGDVTLYRYWGGAIADRGLVPYRDVGIEYPPGSLPFVVVPALAPGSSYQPVFIAIMLLVDLAGLIGLLRLAGRWGSGLGPSLWVALVPLLGPVAYLRLDLVPAVATIWAVERASRRSWSATGAWLAAATAAKLYAAVLFPPLLASAERRKGVARGTLLVLALALLPFAPWGTALARSVLRYHLDRGIEIESVWGVVLLLASKAGHQVRMDFTFESLNVASALATYLKVAAGICILAGVAAATWAAARAAAPAMEERLADVMFATLAVTVALATVLSPQYMLWLAALGAAAVCSPGSVVRRPVLLLVPAAALTQVIYPFLFVRLARIDVLAVVTLAARDLVLLTIAGWALVAVARRPPSQRHADALGTGEQPATKPQSLAS